MLHCNIMSHCTQSITLTPKYIQLLCLLKYHKVGLGDGWVSKLACCASMRTWVSIYTESRCGRVHLWPQQGGQAVITDGYEPPGLGTGNRTPALCNSSKHSTAGSTFPWPSPPPSLKVPDISVSPRPCDAADAGGTRLAILPHSEAKPEARGWAVPLRSMLLTREVWVRQAC